MSAAVTTFAGPPGQLPDAGFDRGGADRYLAFAFAAADLLVETDLEGVIRFAAGAFRSRFGHEAESFLGQPITTLFAACDHETLNVAVALVPEHGRIAPVVLHLANEAASDVAVGAFVRQGADTEARLCFSIGPVASSASLTPVNLDGLQARTDFSRMAEVALRDPRAKGGLGLVEVKGWDRVREQLSADDRRALEGAISEALTGGATGQTAGSLADGRYGLLSFSGIDVRAMVARIEHALRSSPAAAHAKVEGAELALDSGPIPQGQAARTLRYALGRFADGHADATEGSGAGAGLAGIVANAERQTQAMRLTLNERRFRLLYQPVVSLKDLVIHHYEALLRPIATPNMPMKDTQEFVTFAEAMGLSEDLDWAVLETAIAALAASPDASVAVNMSGLSMQNADYRRRLLARIGELRTQADSLAPNRLLIELTETAEIQDMASAASSMEQLRSVGVPVCLDDFGAGSAAFRYLRAFGVDYVKIDGAYVRAAGRSKRDRQLVAAMVDLAATGGARVVAEMIETEAEAALMLELGVQYGQGWLFGKPGRLPGS